MLVQCRLSRWAERKGGWRCRIYSCPDRRLIECIKHEWWKAVAFPDSATRPSVVCRSRHCKEEDIRMKSPGKSIPARKFRRGGAR